MMNARKKPFGLVIIVVLIVVGMIFFYRWLNKKINEIQKEPSTAEQIKTMLVPQKEQEPPRYGKPVIDPHNDPLAPMVGSVRPKETRTKSKINTPLEDTRVHESPQSRGSILAQ
jgi:hypothetical protein